MIDVGMPIKIIIIIRQHNREGGVPQILDTPLSHDDSSLTSQPYFSAWVARMRVKYCGGGKSTYNFHVPPTRKNTAGLRLLRDYDDRC